MGYVHVSAGRLSAAWMVIIAAFMLVSCAGDNAENLADVAKRGDLEAVGRLLESGVDVDTEDNKHHATALMWAAHEGHPDIVRLLIEHGAEINKRKATSETALWFAAQKGQLEAMKVLVQHGADVNIIDREDGSALDIARNNGHLEIVDYLRQAGADG